MAENIIKTKPQTERVSKSFDKKFKIKKSPKDNVFDNFDKTFANFTKSSFYKTKSTERKNLEKIQVRKIHVSIFFKNNPRAHR